VLPRSFYERDVVELARDLVGRELRRGPVRMRITEVEAYGPQDSASHARFGPTERTQTMFGEGGRLYVYLCYGIHQMVNIVAHEEGTAAAILVRSCEPVRGLETIRARRGGKQGPVLLTGPGKIGQALALDTTWSGHALHRRGGVTLHAGEPPSRLLAGPRVGIDYAAPRDRGRAWRFAMPDTPWVSHPKSLKPVSNASVRP
jgi:DNA-3-methyladenine glycosylase